MNKKRYFFVAIVFLLTLQVHAQKDSVHYFQSHDGIKIAFTDVGIGPPIILLHGFINSGSSWNKSVVKEQLVAQGYRVIVPDLRGNGNSEQPEKSVAYQNDAEVKDVMALANHLKLENYMALGYSRGSIVLAKVLTLDNRIHKAIIGGMGADFTDPNWDRRIAFADAFSGRAEPTELTRGAVTYAKSIDANLKILGFLQDYQPVSSATELGAIRIPILIVCGDEDLDNGSPEALQKMIPQSRLTLVKGDHNNTYKQTNFAAAVLAFLRLH